MATGVVLAVKRSIFALFAVLWLPTLATAGSIAGSVLGPAGEPVFHAPVRVTDSANGLDTRRFTDRQGQFVFDDLPAGSYVVEVAVPCCAFEKYKSGPVELASDQNTTTSITLRPADFLIALADDPGSLAVELLERRKLPERAVGRVGGNPDMNGVWLLEDDPFPDEPVPTPWAKKAAEARDPDDLEQDLFALCLPGELPVPGASIPMLTRFVHTPDLLAMLFEGPPGFRQIFLDGRSHPNDPNPAWLGHSVGHWEGETLVIESIGFDTRGQSGDYPRSGSMRLIERYTRRNMGQMDLELTIIDPNVFETPWTRNLHLDFVPQEELIEFVCENNVWVNGDE